MQTTVQTLHKVLLACRPARATMALGLLLILGFAQSGLAQTATAPLKIFQNYFVTGDYVVAGWVEGSPDGTGFAPGTISVPDTKQPDQTGLGVPRTVPKGADIVAAYLYWATVEKSQSAFAGQQGFFNGYPVTGVILGNPNAPTSWSAGGCSGSSNGTTTMRTYRADVRPYLPLDTDPSSPTFGRLLANANGPNGPIPISVRLADSGSNGNTAPNALGATLVIIYRVLSPAATNPLNAIVLYDGAYAPSNGAQSTSQKMVGFYQPTLNPAAKITHIVANGQLNKSEQVYLNDLNSTSQPLPSIYGTSPPFPGIYNSGSASWDNPTWALSQYPYVKTSDTSETTSVVPSSSNSGCVSWGAMILSTRVQDDDGDGLLNVWEDNQGYTDAVSNQFVALPGADSQHKDLFVEVDYLSNMDGSAGTYLHSHLPKQAALDAVGEYLAEPARHPRAFRSSGQRNPIRTTRTGTLSRTARVGTRFPKVFWCARIPPPRPRRYAHIQVNRRLPGKEASYLLGTARPCPTPPTPTLLWGTSRPAGDKVTITCLLATPWEHQGISGAPWLVRCRTLTSTSPS